MRSMPLAQTKFFWPYLLLILLIFLSCLVLIGLSYYALTIKIQDFPDLHLPIETQADLDRALRNYTDMVDLVITFMTTVIGLLLAVMLLGVALVGTLLYILAADRKRMQSWQEIGFACERLELIDKTRIRLNNTELILNKAQSETLHSLVDSRLKGEALNAVDIPSENATQSIKRLREELGAKLIEKTLIVNHRGKGYWLDIDPRKIKQFDDAL